MVFIVASNGVSTPIGTSRWASRSSSSPSTNSVQNLVCTADLNRTLNLNALAIGFGLEQTEYEPEQFPSLIFRQPDASCVALLFSSGKVVLTGCPNVETAEMTFKNIKSQIHSLVPME